jgi:hypothetical protein
MEWKGMDLVEILRERIDSAIVGEYTPGLRAVLQHVRVAVNHLQRGKSTADDAAFTDAIYRTNQAFEGSLKEAYRVLAGKDPAKVRPSDMEAFFQDKSDLRPRVLSQFTRYRTEWRNPSTHDYRLDFDEDEALLAIVSVCAFAIVLVDQMSEKMSFERARAATESPQGGADASRSLADQVADALQQFVFPRATHISGEPPRESEVIGALRGYLTSALSGVQVEGESQLTSERPHRADLMIALGDQRLVVEVKRGRLRAGRFLDSLAQLAAYMEVSATNEAILFVFDEKSKPPLTRTERLLPEDKGRIIVVGAPPEAGLGTVP